MVDMSATILHHGHIRLLEKASKYGDVIVALTTDDEVLKHKGYLPELDFDFRKEIIESIKYVKEVIPSLWKLNNDFLKKNKIDFLVHGEDNSNEIDKKKLLILPRTKGVASSELRKKSATIVGKIKKNILLNPGPATTTDTVKYAQVVPDICPREKEFGDLVYNLSNEITSLATKSPENYTTVFFGGSGTASVEAVISSVISDQDRLLIINNGSYAERIHEISKIYNLNVFNLILKPFEEFNLSQIEKIIVKNKITHLAIVHNETSTGRLNELEVFSKLSTKYDIKLIVDAMSSFGAIEIDVDCLNIDYLCCSSNKNIQGMAGISFVIAKKSSLESIKKLVRKNYYLDLYAQHSFFENSRQLRFTPPVQCFYALKQAIIELKEESIEKRKERYFNNWNYIVKELDLIGFKPLTDLDKSSKIITLFQLPEKIKFIELHDYMLSSDITIYPSKNDLNSFRVANIGDISKIEIELFINKLKEFVKKFR